ncbi:MAG: hypothetical protein ACSW8F_01135 [bacterium]
MTLENELGTLTLRENGLFTEVVFCGKSAPVSRLILRGEAGECPLGVPIPEKGGLMLRKKLPTRALRAIGTPRAFALRPVREEAYPIPEDGTIPHVERFKEARLERRADGLWIVFPPRP